MSEERLVPKLRFRGFDDEWNEFKLGDISDSITKGTTPKKYSENGINFIKVESITNNKITEIDAFIDENTHNNELNRSKLEKNDLLFSIAGSLGRTTIITEDILPANTNQALSIIRFDKHFDMNLNFIQSRLNTYDIDKYIFQNLAVGAQPNLNLQQVKNIKIRLPVLEEQNKIQNFLDNIDKKIELLEKKHKYYQDFKKYLMQQIFTGKLRFDFNDEWKQYKLKDLLTVNSSSISINQLEDNTGTYPLYGASGFLKNIDFCEMETDYISIVKDGSGVGNLSYHEKNSSIVNTSQYLLPKKNFDIHFLYYLLQTLNLLKYVNGSSIPHIYFKDYCIEKVNVPSLPEQQQIGKLFADTDKTMKNINNCINVTKEFKKGLLQQMFV